MSRTANVANLLLIGLFALGLCLPWWDTLFDLDPTPDLQEYRQLAGLPELSLASLQAYPPAFEDYLNDHLGFRRWLIQTRAVLLVKGLHSSSNPSEVILGRDSWLFSAREKIYFLPEPALPVQQLAAWQRTLENNRAWLAGQGIVYLVVVTPTKGTVYPEYLPAWMPERRDTSLDQLLAYLADHSDVQVLDLRPGLARAKSQGLLYFPLDLHWNSRGAFVAYQEIIARLRLVYPQLSPASSLSDYESVAQRSWIPPLIRQLGLGGLWREPLIELVPKQPRQAQPAEEVAPFGTPETLDWVVVACIDDPSLPAMLMFHNSFGDALRPFLAEHFRRSAFFSRDYLGTYERAADILGRERPQILVHQISEIDLELADVGLDVTTLGP